MPKALKPVKAALAINSVLGAWRKLSLAVAHKEFILVIYHI